MTSRRGYTLVELLVSLVILAISVAGMLALWSFCFGVTARSQDYGVAYNIARQEMEQARSRTYMFVQTAPPQPYDHRGRPMTTGGTPAFTATTTVAAVPNAHALSQAVVEVRSQQGELVFETTTYFTRGGV